MDSAESRQSRLDVGVLPSDQEDVMFQVAMCGPLQPRQVREYSGVRGRRLSVALSALQRRGLAWRGVSGAWHATELGLEWRA
jgi:hypothetical protein